MDLLLNQVQSYAASSSAAIRESLKIALRDIIYSLEDDDDVVRRVGYNPLETASVRVGIELKLFDVLVEHQEPITLDEIASKTGAQAALLERILRYLAATGYVNETGVGKFQANAVTKKLTLPANKAGICHMWDTCGPQFMEMPKYLAKRGYAEPTDFHQTVFQDAFATEKGAFDWFQDHPKNLQYFNDFMASRRDVADTWLSVYPVAEEVKDWPADRPVYVNMGGGIGHQCAQFKKEFPNAPGRVILQDLPHTIDKALQTPGVENMAHDFTTPQPIKGSKFYFVRGVLHNHPDERVKIILGHIRDAMADDSVLLIDEIVLPDSGTNANAAGIDLAMMCAAASRERTRSQWQNVLGSVGLKIDKELTYKASMYETVMRVVKA